MGAGAAAESGGVRWGQRLRERLRVTNARLPAGCEVSHSTMQRMRRGSYSSASFAP